MSKPLINDDQSGFNFSKEMLAGDHTFGINFDRVQWNNKLNCFVIIEYLLCDESQSVTPHTSHPNRYFHNNKHKFISLWELTKKLDGLLYLINYAKKDTPYGDEVLLMAVINVDRNAELPVETSDTKFTREKFSQWFRNYNKLGQE